jgi:N-acetylneuraminic acid mutarotase
MSVDPTRLPPAPAPALRRALSLALFALALVATGCGADGGGGGGGAEPDAAGQGGTVTQPDASGGAVGPGGQGGGGTTGGSAMPADAAVAPTPDAATPPESDAATPPACSVGESRCNGDVVESCVAGTWVRVVACAGDETCVEGVCRPVECTPACDGRACGDDGCGGDCGACDGECIDGRCARPDACVDCPVEACGDGQCVAPETPGDCPRDCQCPPGTGWDFGTARCVALSPCDPPCAGGDVCEAGVCVPPGARCGDDACEAGESCATCPADCGFCCGDGACVADDRETCATCPVDCGCAADERCDVPTATCVIACTPDCGARMCGDDGCGGSCGACGPDEACDRDGLCVVVPAVCGDGTCQAAEDCNSCVGDCGQCCGDGACDPAAGETCATCARDCRCAAGEACDLVERRCEAPCVRDCNGRLCGDDGCGGSCGDCGPGGLCEPVSGTCEILCTPLCDGRNCGDDGCGGVCGECDDGAVCTGAGRCVGGGPACQCAVDQACLDGRCRPLDHVCSPDVPDGLCGNGLTCAAGVCVESGAACSDQNPTGVCPVGQVCRNGACEIVDGALLCDDQNACTLDFFDHVTNRCGHAPQVVACSDGNGCTRDACVEGACVGTPVAGCVAPPTIAPYPPLTNQVALRLTGDKAAGDAIYVDGQEAIPGDQSLTWGVQLNLVPGENVYRIQTSNPAGMSGVVEVRVVYDIVAPTTTISPAGGTFLDGVGVTIASSEPARVYCTTDGSEPTEAIQWFQSLRTVRIYDPTTVKCKARDLAGNWEAATVSAQFNITRDGGVWSGVDVLPAGLTHASAVGIGAVLYVVGGSDGAAAQATAVSYDTRTGAFTNLAALPVGRSELALVATTSTTLLAIGGENDAVPLNLVSQLDLNNPGAGWTPRAAMPSTRFGLQAAPSGAEIFVFGGKTNGGVVLNTVEAYNPGGNAWRNNLAAMPRARYGFSAIARDGKIYLIGGEDEAGRPIAEVDVYTPANNAWSQVGDLPTPRSFATATLEYNVGAVNGGPTNIVVAGGRLAGGVATSVVEAFTIEENAWRPMPSMPTPRHSAAGATLDAVPARIDAVQVSGFAVGGQTTAGLSAELSSFTVARDYLRELAPLPAGRFMHAAAALGERIYLLGGREFQETTVAWVFDPETETYEQIADLPTPQNGLSAVAFNDRVWAVGGMNAFGIAVPKLRYHDAESDAWVEMQPMLTARRDAVAVFHDGRLYVIGGDNNGAVQSVEVYDPATNRWAQGPALPEARSGAVGVSYNGAIYVAGGRNAAGTVIGSILRLQGNVWAPVPGDIPVANATAAVIGSQLAVFAGRSAGGLSNLMYRYDLTTQSLGFALVPATRLLPAWDFQAAATVNGDVFLFGGNDAVVPGPSGQVRAFKYAGRCLNGVIDPYEGMAGGNFPDIGNGCGGIDPFVALTPGWGFGHHGSCGQWNGCGSAQGCANMACAYYGHGPAQSWGEGQCTSVGQCNLFQGANSIDFGYRGCELPVAINIRCARR